MQYKLKKRRFTLIEMMVSMGVFLILLTLLLNFFSGTRQVWKTLRDRNDSFEKARVAMDIMSDLLTTSVADAENIDFVVDSDNSGCTFFTRTTRSLVSPGSTNDGLGNELNNYYLVNLYAESGKLKVAAKRIGKNYDGTFSAQLSSSQLSSLRTNSKTIIDAVSKISFKKLVDNEKNTANNTANNKRCNALEIALTIFDSKENYDKYNSLSGAEQEDFKAAHAYMFTRVISFDDVTDPIYEVTNEKPTPPQSSQSSQQ